MFDGIAGASKSANNVAVTKKKGKGHEPDLLSSSSAFDIAPFFFEKLNS